MVRKLLLALILFLGLPFAGCKTIDVWDGGFPKSAAQLPTPDAKAKELAKFSIHEADARYDEGHGYIQTQHDKDTDKYFSLGSFAPVIMRVSPETKADFAAIRTGHTWGIVSSVVIVAGALLSWTPNHEGLGDTLVIVGLVGTVAAGQYQENKLDGIKATYNDDLNVKIRGVGLRSDSGRPLGFGWAFEL